MAWARWGVGLNKTESGVESGHRILTGRVSPINWAKKLFGEKVRIVTFGRDKS